MSAGAPKSNGSTSTSNLCGLLIVTLSTCKDYVGSVNTNSVIGLRQDIINLCQMLNPFLIAQD